MPSKQFIRSYFKAFTQDPVQKCFTSKSDTEVLNRTQEESDRSEERTLSRTQESMERSEPDALSRTQERSENQTELRGDQSENNSNIAEDQSEEVRQQTEVEVNHKDHIPTHEW